MDIQSIGLIAMIALSTLFQVISFFKGDKNTAVKLEKERQKAIEKLKKQSDKLEQINKKIEDSKGE